VCGAIFRKAGRDELADACFEIGGCETGNAVITQGFNLSARYVIHAVGPVWEGGNSSEAELLYDAYKNSLILAKENGYRSIGFPLISSGIYGYPKDSAWEIAVRSCRDFINDNSDYHINIIFAVLSDESQALGEKAINEII
jgi:O-acetyl-ADP-ribose deacetylase (regulator of RNase III)